MSDGAPPPITPGPMGKGCHHERGSSLHESVSNVRNAAHVDELNNKRGLHKLMRSGTRFGNVVKFFYRMIWDLTYR